MTSSRSSFRDGRGFDRLLVTLTLAFLLVFSAFPLFYNFLMSVDFHPELSRVGA